MSDNENRDEVPLLGAPGRGRGGDPHRGRGGPAGGRGRVGGAEGGADADAMNLPPSIQALTNLLGTTNLDDATRSQFNEVIYNIVCSHNERDSFITNVLDRVGAPPPRVPADRDPRANLERQVDRFWKKAPRFTLGSTSWTNFMKVFTIAACEVADDGERKKMLYACLQGEAQTLACQKMFPLDVDNQRLSFNDYTTKMRELFEPVAESENAKLEFTERQQLVGENPTFYYQKKLALFERAWPRAMRDMRYFYDEVTKGLTNELMKSQLWSFEPDSPDDYERRMKYLAAVVQKRYRAREISEAQALGAETSIQGYACTNGPKPFVKQEPGVHAMAEETAVCYYCRKRGHFARNCPRKSAGLTPPAAAVGEDEEGTDEVDETHEEEEVNFVRNGRAFRGKPYRFQRLPRNNRFNTRTNPKPVTKKPDLDRIGVLYMDENGEQFLQEDEQEEMPTEESINTVQLEEMQDQEDHSEADFVPYPFLGLTASNHQA